MNHADKPPTSDFFNSLLEQLESGAIDIPNFDDERWQTRWTLQHERAEPTAGQ